MKTVVRFLTLILVAATLTACGSSDGANKRGRVTDRGGRDTIRGGDEFTSDISGSLDKWGQVYRDSSSTSSQNAFQERVMKFVSSNMDPYSDTSGLGEVSGELGQETGIFIAGDVRVRGGFNGTSTRADVELSGSSFALIVWDSFASMTDSNGDYVGGYGFSQANAAYGYVDGNQAVIEWEDEYGHVWLEGYINNDFFEGYIYFENHYSQTDIFRANEGELLGRFFVPTCQFFRCN